jgi:F-type H+-transporting ATPase subunit epsilon
LYPEFHLEIYTPERLFYDDEVQMVIVECSDGEVGILKGHIPMVAAINIGELRILTGGKWKIAAINEGFMEVRPDATVIIVRSVEWPEEIDAHRAEEAKVRAEERLRQRRSMSEYHQSKAALARAMARLRVKKEIL